MLFREHGSLHQMRAVTITSGVYLGRLAGAWTGLLALAAVVLVGYTATTPELHLQLRSRVEMYKGSGDWRAVAIDESFSPSSSALILCDMWDNHWCQGAAGRVGILARKIAPVVDLARSHGFLIIRSDRPIRLCDCAAPRQERNSFAGCNYWRRSEYRCADYRARCRYTAPCPTHRASGRIRACGESASSFCCATDYARARRFE